MSGIKGVVILTRFDFIENAFGRETLNSFFPKIEFDDYETLRQPVVISKEYPEKILSVIDNAMLKEFFKGEVSKFYSLGEWNARHILPRYFQNYIDEQDPSGFLFQMARMRPILIGLGEMHVSSFNKTDFGIHISYGQPYTIPVKLSEIGFLVEGCHLCGAENAHYEELETSETSVDYQISWDI